MLLKDINKLASKLNNLPKVSRGLHELFQDHIIKILMGIYYHHDIKGVGAYLDSMHYQLDWIEIYTNNNATYIDLCVDECALSLVKYTDTAGKVNVTWRSCG